MKCFYHNADFDGKCSAAIVRYANPSTELIGINYGDEFPWEIIQKDERVYMVDFSLQPFSDMVRLNEMCDLFWIDHHKTAIDDEKKSGVKIDGLRRIGIGACALVWEFLFNTFIPDGVRLLAEYDVWNHTNPETLPFQYGLRLANPEPNDDVWFDLFDNYPSISMVINTGKTIIEYETSQNKIQASVKSFDLEFDGLKFIAMNHGPANSQVFSSVWDPEKYDAMMLFYIRRGIWKVSLYTEKEGVDVSEVAKRWGGGGHKQAAGFQVDDINKLLKS